ncbi:ribosomal oxygenase 2-like isoform X2 [Branchiostoma lanceolatum]|uniref:ribosomal oxygenase 2-like isoform X2 n=1 Tax=Branchiostoma lanceolatum TaxID=7740 RepID=UPI003452C0E9
MKPSHVQLKRQKRRENRRRSREKKKLWNQINESLVLTCKTSTDTSSKKCLKDDNKLAKKTSQIFLSGDKNERDMMEQKTKKKETKLPKLTQTSSSEASETMKSPQKAKKKAKRLKEKGKPLVEKSSHAESVQLSKQKTSSEKRPLSQSKEQPASAKRLKTKKLVEKRELNVVSGRGRTARFDLSSPQNLFESIISPVSYEQFFDEYWEKKPLIKRNDAAVLEAYKALFSRDILKKLLKKHDIQYIRDVNVCRYVNGKRESLNGTERATCKQIDKLFDQSKTTLQFHQPQRFQDKLWQLCSLLECLFGCLVGANVYMTPPGSQGLAPHYDDVEVFILQLEGRKHWRLYTPPVDLPRDYSRDLEQDSIGKPTHDFVLEAGDMLYFPRGTVHQADTPAGSQHSTHVTISTYQQNSYGDLLTSTLPMLVQTVMDTDVEFRKGLPVGTLSTVGIPMGQDSPDMRSHLQKLLVSLADQVASSSAPLLAPELLQDFMSNRLPPYYKDTSETLASPKGSPPNLNSFVKMRFPGYMALCLQTPETEETDDEEDENGTDDDAEGDEDDDEDGTDDDDDSDEEEDEDDSGKDDEEDDDEEEGEKADGEKCCTQGTCCTSSTGSDVSDLEWVYLYHCLHNRREDHMMDSNSGQLHGLKFPAKFLPVLQNLLKMSRDDSVQVKGLGLESEDKVQVATYLWAEGLIEIC